VSTATAPTLLVTGGHGQLGLALQSTVPPAWRVVACGADELDVTRPELVRSILERERPTVVVHAAAYTAVDDAEREPERAEAVNAAGTAHVTEMARQIGARLVYISTDFVFDGAQGRPYTPADPPNPLSVYGRTKLAGEVEAERLSGGTALVVRTAWVYSAQGHNFVTSILRALQERESLDVVSDQVGTPTWAHSLAEALWAAAACPSLTGVHHWTDAGVASWYDLAVAVQEEATALGLLSRTVPIRPVRTQDSPRAARRPSYSVLDKTATWAALSRSSPHWRENLRRMLGGLRSA
jgi:dTDP-4-dehydrorhamnose reductase